MPELLLELFSEEIPARMQGRAAEDLKRLVTEKLKLSSIEFASAQSYVTPRRLTLFVDGLPGERPATTEEKKGPRVGSPDQAIQGFLRSVGLTSLDQCEKQIIGKAEFWVAKIKHEELPTPISLLQILSDVIWSFPWPKSMKWIDQTTVWVRPLRKINCAWFPGDDRPYQIIHIGDLGAGDFETEGHRFLAPGKIRIDSFADYKAKLQAAKVMLDPAERRDMILREAEDAAKREGLTLKQDIGLLEEVTGLVEWPRVVVGSIDKAFMDLPPEVMITSMRAHQKYFALLNSDGSLASRFLVVSNMETDEEGRKNIVAGNERVLRARLSDAKFFWDQDRKTRLEDRVPALSKIVFHAKLGTLGERVERMAALSADLCEHVPGADRGRVRSAAVLAKADLTSGMVGEFPELQGAMGRYYALAEGERTEVADAIAEHYAPRGPEDRCPTAPASVAVALAEKLDTLMGFFAIDEKPTGSKDPFALRRAALGVIRLVLENKLRLPLRAVFARAQALHGKGDAQVPDALMAFFADRLKVHLREAGTRHDLVTAVFALGGEDDLVRLLARVDALARFLATDDGANLLVAYRRAANIVAIEEKKDKARHDGAVDAALLSQPEEASLHKALEEAGGAFGGALAKEDFAAAMSAMARLRAPVDAFFDKVTVNAPEAPLRANRLRLLSQIRATMNRVADFSKLEG